MGMYRGKIKQYSLVLFRVDGLLTLHCLIQFISHMHSINKYKHLFAKNVSNVNRYASTT